MNNRRNVRRSALPAKPAQPTSLSASEMVEALVEWAEFIHEHGAEAAIARADTARAEREAAKDRSQALDDKGDDANDATSRIVTIRSKTQP